MSPKLRAHGSELHGPSKPRWPITSDLRQEPGALAAPAGICAGGSGVTRPLTATIRTRRLTPKPGWITAPNRSKLIMRMAYRFRDDQYFIPKITAAFPGNSG